MHLCIVRLLSIDHPALSRPIAHAVIVIDYDRKKVAESDRSIAHTRTQSGLCLRAAVFLPSKKAQQPPVLFATHLQLAGERG